MERKLGREGYRVRKTGRRRMRRRGRGAGERGREKNEVEKEENREEETVLGEASKETREGKNG